MASESSAISSTITVTSSALSSNSRKGSLSLPDIAIVIGSVTIGLSILICLVFVVSIRRSRRKNAKEHGHPEDNSKCLGAVESQESFVAKPHKNDMHSMFKRAEADPLITTKTAQRVPLSESQYIKDAYTRSTSSVKNYYAGLATHETHTIPLIIGQYPEDNVGFETAALHSGQPGPSKSTIKLAPLTIPGKIPNRSNGERSIKKTASRKSTKHLDSDCDSDDSASLYSVASASVYYPKSSLETIKPPPVPSIPIHFVSSTQSTVPEGTDVAMIPPGRDEEKPISKSLPPIPSLSLPSLKFNGDNGEEAEDETQIYNVAKLLQSRQARLQLPKDGPSRNASVVSHIERSGSISALLSPTDEKSYRPRYYRLKQKRNTTRDSISSNLSSTPIPDTLSTLSAPPQMVS